MENVLERVLRISRPPASRRVEIQELYRRYMSGMTMSVTTILQFLHIEQMELTANEETAVELIEKYEIVQSGKRGYESCEGLLPQQPQLCFVSTANKQKQAS